MLLLGVGFLSEEAAAAASEKPSIMSDHVRIYLVLKREFDHRVQAQTLVSLTESHLGEPDRVEQKSTEAPILRAQDMNWEILRVGSSYAVCGTTLFLLGGMLKTASALGEMHLIDLEDSSSSRGWMKGPSMRAGRTLPGAVSVDGKMYVFRGLNRPRRGETLDEPWAEVYDT